MSWLQRVGAAVALSAVLGLGLEAMTVTSVSFHSGAASRATTIVAVQAGRKTKKHKKATAVKAAYPAACAAEADASAGSWSSAESEYAVAETQAVKNLGAVAVFASLGLDAGTVALDQVGGTSTTSAVSTYNRDLTAGKQWFKGCK